MSGYLLDTNVLSLLAPRRANEPARGLRDWIARHEGELHLSVVTVAEIQSGISRLERRGATAKAAALSDWLEAVMTLYGERILPLDARSALEAGRLLDRAAGAGGEPGFEDAAIAAIAAIHGLTVVTANERHFRLFGVPFEVPAAG